MYRMIVSDNDGVLSTPGNGFLDKSVSAIKKAYQTGLEFAVATGRSLEYMHKSLEKAGLNANFVIAENGGVIYDAKTGQMVVYDQHLDSLQKAKQEFYNKCKPNGGIGVMYEGHHVIEEPSKQTMFTVKPMNPQNPMDMGYSDQAVISAIHKGLRETIAPDSPLYLLSHVDSAELVQLGIDKGVALETIAKRYNIPLEQIVGIGDGINDLPMLAKVGLPTAVANAKPAVKSFVLKRNGYVSPHSLDKGVEDIVEFVLRQQEN